jgi:DNA-binding IclR family transcriptional regulator
MRELTGTRQTTKPTIRAGAKPRQTARRPGASLKADANTTDTPIGAANSPADRAIDIMLLFTDDKPLWSAAEIAGHFHMPRSTTYRYLNSLRSYALIVEDDRGGYCLGPRIFPLARVAKANLSILQIAAPHLRSLSEQFGEMFVIHERVGSEIIALDRTQCTHRVTVTSTRSHILPWPATGSAKVLLGFAPESERKAIMTMLQPTSYTRRTLVDMKALEKTLDDIVKAGFATTEEERDEGVWGVAAPIFVRGAARYCLAMAAPRFRMDKMRIAAVTAAIRNAARKITTGLAETEF